jgi:lipoprotein Spr
LNILFELNFVISLVRKNIFSLRYSIVFFLLFFVSCHHNKDVSKKVDIKPSVSKTHIVAEKLGVSEKEIKNKKLYTFIGEWYGTPYKYSGCDKNGIDCSCFTGTLYLKVYGKTVARNSALIYKDCERIKTSHLKEGDFVFFKIGSKDVSHVGIYLKGNKFVHASTSKGVMISDLEEPYFKKYYFEAGRLRN